VATLRLLGAHQAREAPFACDVWIARPVNTSREDLSSGFVHDTYESQFNGDFSVAVDRLLAYRLFPPHRMRACVCTEDGCVRLGATIIQRTFFPPFAIESAVRVVEFELGPDRLSYSYATVLGHPERGIETFTVIRLGNGVRFEVNGWSRSGHWLTAAGRPVARALQKMMTREAIDAFAQQ